MSALRCTSVDWVDTYKLLALTQCPRMERWGTIGTRQTYGPIPPRATHRHITIPETSFCPRGHCRLIVHQSSDTRCGQILATLSDQPTAKAQPPAHCALELWYLLPTECRYGLYSDGAWTLSTQATTDDHFDVGGKHNGGKVIITQDMEDWRSASS